MAQVRVDGWLVGGGFIRAELRKVGSTNTLLPKVFPRITQRQTLFKRCLEDESVHIFCVNSSINQFFLLMPLAMYCDVQ